MHRARVSQFTIALFVTAGCADDSGVTQGDDEGTGTSSTGGEDDASQSSTLTAADTSGTSGTDSSDPTSQSESQSDSDSESSGSTGEDAGIQWYPCPLYTGGAGFDAECADIEVPLDWADPGGEQINFFVKRTGHDGTGQVHLLHGGPGFSGMGLEGFGEGITNTLPHYDAYMIDHRGTGRSTRLSCDGELPNSPEGVQITGERYQPCLDQLEAEWGDRLHHFTTSNAARDLGYLIDELAELDQKVHVWGGSYGTYYATRYLQLFPDQADGVTMLGVAAPGFDFRFWEEDYNYVGEQYLALCDDDPLCSTKLGPDTVARAHTILGMVEEGHCSQAGLDRESLQAYFATRLAWTWYDRVLIPAILYRVERCDPADVVALQTAAPQMVTNPFAGADPILRAPLLGQNISLGEMYKLPLPTDEELQAIHDNAIISFGSQVGSADSYDAWNTYEDDEYVDEFPDTDVPVLMIHGEFDPNAPLDGITNRALDLGDALTAPGQRFVTMPGGSHGWDSPMSVGGDCSYQLFYEFLDDAIGPLVDCTGLITPVTFDQNFLAPGFFGTADLWEN